MPFLADTNVVTRRILPSDPKHYVIAAALLKLDQRGERVYVCTQTMIEFRALATRPVAANGLGLSVAQAATEAAQIESIFPLLTDTPSIYPLWRDLVEQYQVVGRQVYDARIVAVMQAYGLADLLTMDARDFNRYAPIVSAIDPSNLT